MSPYASFVAVGAIDLAQDRALAMIRDMLASGRHTQKSVGDVFGVEQAMVSLYKKGTNKPGLKAITSAIDNLRMNPLYFFDPTLEEPLWSEFVDFDEKAAKRESFDWRLYVRPDDSPGWQRFAERYLARFVAEGLSEEEVLGLRALPFRGGPPDGPGAYVDHAETMLARNRMLGMPVAEVDEAREAHRAKGGGRIVTGLPRKT